LNWSLQYTELLDSWSPPLERLPRWFSCNSYTSINEPQFLPEFSTVPATSTLTLATSGAVPISWVLSEPSREESSNNFQKLLGSIFTEFQYLLPSLQSLYLTRGGGFDVVEPDTAWYASYPQTYTTIQAKLTDNSLYTINQVQSDLSLFTSPTWTYKQQNNEFLFYGLSLQEQVSESRNTEWQYISNSTKFESTALSYWKHPYSGAWIPLLPSQVREDGLLGLKTNKNLYVRTLNRETAKSLDRVLLQFDNEDVYANRVALWNSVDDKGLLYLLKRFRNEDSLDLGNKLLATSWFSVDQRTSHLKNALAIAVGQYSVETLVPGATGTVDSSYSGFTIAHTLQTETFLESRLTLNSSGTLNSIYSDVVRGTAFIENNPYEVTNVSGVVTINGYSPSRLDNVSVYWVVDNWTASASGVTLHPNTYKNSSDFLLLKTKMVDVENNNKRQRIKAFKYWPGLKWQINENIDNKVIGLGTFE